MTFASPLGLLALLAIPAIVAIHLYRRRFPPRRIAGLFLWQVIRQTPVEGRRIDRLPITTSLILECLAALALALILAGARISSAGPDQHLVVLLDDSASMSAVNARGESARDRAARRVLAELDRLGSRARVTLVLSGSRPSVLVGPAAYAVEARRTLEGWRPQASDHSLALGIRLARELSGPTGRLMVLSDVTAAARGEGDATGALWAAVGEPLDNVGITAADRTVTPAEGRAGVTLTLGNYSDKPQRRRVTVVAGGKDVLARDLEVPPGTSSIALPLVPGLPPVRVALADDALMRDNAVTLAEPRPRIVGVENRLREGRGREGLIKALDSVSGVTRAESGHLAFVDAGELENAGAPGVWRVGFGRPPPPWLTGTDGTDFVGPFVLEKRHPLLAGVTLDGVVWPGAAPVATTAVRPLVSAGDRVLVGMRAPGPPAEPAILFNLDLNTTNLIRAPDWPILVSNLVEMRRQALPGPQRWNYRVGEWIRLRLGRTPNAPLRLRTEDLAGAGPRPSGVERDLPSDRDLEFVAPSPGGLLQIREGDEVLFEIGVNFLDESESDLRGRATADAGELAEGLGPRAEGAQSSDPLFWILLAAGGVAIVANWWLLTPRRAAA